MSDQNSRERRNPIGPTTRTVGENVRRVREASRLTQAQLATRLAENGHPIPVSSIGRIESGGRRVEVDDLVALAIALGVGPLALLLPDSRLPSDAVELTGWGTVQAAEAWMWGASAVPLVLDGSVEDMESEVHAAHRMSGPWWLEAPYVRVADVTSQVQKVRLSLHDETAEEVFLPGLKVEAPQTPKE
ncbi:helix-turn-helix transcriptional regulator [Microbacterium sp. NPDC077184]|uniref:helix-turn-helix domain-containing protein n=1 Tax=Microbacterium sp. NPDC077184 TaxID=3154764 RepID=UPI00344951A1